MSTTTKTKPRAMSARNAVIHVLEHADAPMRPQEVIAAVIDQKLAPGLKGKTPAATISAQLYLAAKAGQVKHLASGKFKAAR
jgi:hypothetical protein